MALPTLGPPEPVAAPAYRPITPTRSQMPEAPTTTPTPYDSMRLPGTSTLGELFARTSTQPYEPPIWARQFVTPTADFMATQTSAAQDQFQQPGLPERVNVNPFGTDPIGSFFGGDAGVAIGITPGQQVGGAYHGIATAPINLANFSTWGRERVLAGVLSLLGRDYQQGTEQADGGPGGTVVDSVVHGLTQFGDFIWGLVEAPKKQFDNMNAFNRGKDVREILQRGATEGFWVERATSAVFGGSEKYTMDGLRAAAARKGIDVIDAMSGLFDLQPEQISKIASNPYMTDDELGKITDGSPLSLNPLTNLGLDGLFLLATLGVGGSGIARAGAKIAELGAETIGGAFGAGIRGARIAEDAGAALQAARTTGYLTRKAMQINNWNTVAGWTIGGAEWGIKQIALVAGNEELVKAMDRLMWQMPLSMNPGWNLIDGFSSHPLDALRNLRAGVVDVGRRGTPGYVGQIDLRTASLRDAATGRVMEVGGRRLTLRPGSEEFKVLGRLADLTPDDLHQQFFSQLNWSKSQLEMAFGEGNPYGLTWDDARNALFHVALQAVREGKGPLGRFEGLDLPTMHQRSLAFVRDNAAGAMKMLEDNLKGDSHAMVDLFKGDFWDLAARNDTKMGATKAYLGPWDPNVALSDFVSWAKASKQIREAMAQGVIKSADATAVYRRDVNRTYVNTWREELAKRYQPDAPVDPAFINLLKRYGGAVENRGKGDQLIRRGGRQRIYTRRQLEAITEDVLAADERFRAEAGTPAAGVKRQEAAAYRGKIDPGQDPIEDARVAGVPVGALDTINAARASDTIQATAPPILLLRHVAQEIGRTVDDILREGPQEAWGTIFDWLDHTLEKAVATRDVRNNLTAGADALRARMADGRMDAKAGAAGVNGLVRLRDELLRPLDEAAAASHHGLYEQWQATAQEAVVLSEEMKRHLDDAASGWRVAEPQGDLAYVVPASLGTAEITALQKLITRSLDLANESDRALLEDPTLHPFLKIDALRRSLAPDDLPELAHIEEALGTDGTQFLMHMAGDAGVDVTDMRAAAETMTSRARSYPDQGADLGARAAQLARRFETMGGEYSEDLKTVVDRTFVADEALRKGTKGKRVRVQQVAMDPEAGAIEAAARGTPERIKAKADLHRAEQAQARAQHAMATNQRVTWDNPTGQAPPVEMPRPVIPALRPHDKLEYVQSMMDGLRSGKVEALDLADVLPSAIVRDASYAPEEMAKVGRYLEAEKGRLEKEIADNVTAGVDTKRSTNQALAWVDSKLADLDRRKQPAPAPEAPPVTEAPPEAAPVEPAAAPEPVMTHQAQVKRPDGKWYSMGSYASKAEADARIASVAHHGGYRVVGKKGFTDRLTENAAEVTPVAPPVAVGGDATFTIEGSHANIKEVPAEFQLVPIDSLIASADPGFDPILQPRDLNQTYINDIAGKFSADEALRTESGAKGMPVIEGRNMVVAGNHRTYAMRAMSAGKWAQYKEALRTRAPEFGLTPEQVDSMDRPVLVRNIGTATADLALALNGETRRMTAPEMARAVAGGLTFEDLNQLSGSASIDTALVQLQNRPLIARALDSLPVEDRPTYIDGQPPVPTEAGYALVKNALIIRALGGDYQFVADVIRDPAKSLNRIEKIWGGVQDALVKLGQAEAKIGAGVRFDTAPAFGETLAEAIRRVRSARVNRESTLAARAEHLTSAGDAAGSLARVIDEMDNQAEVATFLRTVADDTLDGMDPTQMGMFGAPEPPTLASRVNVGINAINDARKAEGPMATEMALMPELDGTTIVRDHQGAETGHIIPVHDDPAAVIEAAAPVINRLVIEGNDWAGSAEHIARTTGPVTFRVDTEAEAQMLHEALDGGERPPTSYRVVNGQIEPLGRGRQSMDELRAALEGREYEVVVGGDPALGETVIAGSRPRVVPPTYEADTGLPPVVPEVDNAARAAAASGAHRIVPSSDDATMRAAERAAGAPNAEAGPRILEVNRPAVSERQRLAQEAVDAAARDVETARAALDALGPAPAGPPPTEILTGSELDLYHRYIATSDAAAPSIRQPRTVGEVVDLLSSLDLSMPPLHGEMSEVEMETLRQALLRTLHARLDDLGAPAEGGRIPTRPPARGGPSRPGVGTENVQPVVSTPEDFSADLAEVMRTLQGRVTEAADPLQGWEGTQYEIGHMPSKANDGGPLAPRIPVADWVNQLDEMIPGLGDELLTGRTRAWPEREADARFGQWMENMPGANIIGAMRSAADTAFGARPERLIVKQSIDRFVDELRAYMPADATAEMHAEFESQVHAIVGRWHDLMKEHSFSIAKLPKYRRIGLVPPDMLDRYVIGDKLIPSLFGESKPEWLQALLADAQKKGIKHPLAEAWRRTDNRIRAHFAGQPGGISSFLDTIYDRVAPHELGRNLTVAYHLARFAMDVRWLGLEAIEAPTLVLFREGPMAMLEGLSKRASEGAMFMGHDVEQGMRDSYAWWLGQSDPGAMLRSRDRYIMAMVRRTQASEFPRVVRQAAADSPDIAGAIRAFHGGDVMAYARELDGDLELAAKRSRPLEKGEAERLFKPWLDRGIISPKEYDEFLREGRYTGHPGIDKAIAESVNVPGVHAMLERLSAINEQGWNDATKLIFGQADRSNVQRLFNHPLLYWPISYQIKATKWLAGLLFDRAFGVDTGSGGAFVLGTLHEEHKKRMLTDPTYAKAVATNPTLLFVAQMLFPIAPWDLGVGLSPFTRLAMAMATNDDPKTGYRRNIMSVGPGYTLFSLLPRLFYEQSKPGSWGADAGILNPIFQAGQRIFPYSIPVAPTTSGLGSAERQVYGVQPMPPVPPFQTPDTRFR